jgi:hypothetical protein
MFDVSDESEVDAAYVRIANEMVLESDRHFLAYLSSHSKNKNKAWTA